VRCGSRRGDVYHFSLKEIAARRFIQAALHKDSAIRIIVLKFAELLWGAFQVSTKLSSLVLKTLQKRNFPGCTSASGVHEGRAADF